MVSNRVRGLQALCGTAILSALAACGGRAESSGTADLRAQLEGSRVCAALISPTWPIEGSADFLAKPGIDALIAAGLVEREPVEDPSHVTPRARISMTKAGEPYLRLYKIGPDAPPEPQLCFGKKHVTAITREDGGPVQYRYRIVDAPAWTKREDMRAAFPFLTRRLDKEQQATIGTFESNGRWQIAGGVDQANLAEIGNKGFLPCPYENAAPSDDPCR
jgi:hypothetical protein